MDCVAILALQTSTDFRTKDVKLVNATLLDLCRFSVTTLTDSVVVGITWKVVGATVVRRTSTTAKLVAKTVHLVTIWCKKLSTSTEPK